MVKKIILKLTILLLFSPFSLSLAENVSLNAANENFIDRQDVKNFIDDMVTFHQFNKPQLVTLFKSVKLRQTVITKINKPIEYKPWNVYRLLFITDKQINDGVAFWDRYQDTLDRAEKQYGVPASVIVATMGIETKYGHRTGNYPVIDALVNLAFSNLPRSAFFKKELIEFLLLTREQKLDPAKVMGSYAGAIGQPQFMPSSYRSYAVNFSGNPTIDLSHNEIDVIGSIANYYKKNGWQPEQLVALPVSFAGGRFQLHFTKTERLTLPELVMNGFVQHDFKSTPTHELMVLQSNYGNEYWLCFHNFYVIKKYNHSDLYAMAVYQLSYYIAARRGKLISEVL